MMVMVVAVAVIVVSGASAVSSPRVTVQPRNALLDAPFSIRVTGLKPRQTVTVKLAEPAYRGGVLSAAKRVQADAEGVVSLPRSDMLALTASQGSKVAGYPLFRRNLHVSVTAKGKLLARTDAARYVTAPSVAISDQRPGDGGFYGEYFRPTGTKSHAAVVVVGGSEGGLANGYASGLLASHGFPVLQMAYFGEPGLPSTLKGIPLEYFQRAVAWLGKQPEVDPKRISVVGISRGGELALLLGATYPNLINGVAAYVPSDTVNPSPLNPSAPAWTVAGKPVPAARIEVEKINGGVFLIGGGDDQLWPSGQAVEDIKQRMHTHKRDDVTALVYPRAGHGAGEIVPNIPTAPIITSRYGTLFLGGTPSADAAARADSWPKLLRFLAAPR